MHVDGASGAMVAPFLDPDIVWDFRLPRVQSINTSGHKFGLVYPGVGWVIWRDSHALPADLVFHVDYLGGSMPTFALNFSRPGAQVAAQYFNFLRLGMEGYRQVQQACRDTAAWLGAEIERHGRFTLVYRGPTIPAFAIQVAQGQPFTVYDVSHEMRARGWLVPAYPLPDGMSDVHVLRVVVRNGFSRDLASRFLSDLRSAVETLERRPPSPEKADAVHSGFHH
jgi:glutamate decarboxylase